MQTFQVTNGKRHSTNQSGWLGTTALCGVVMAKGELLEPDWKRTTCKTCKKIAALQRKQEAKRTKTKKGRCHGA